MKCNEISKGSFAAIELILIDIKLDKSKIPLSKLLNMIDAQVKAIRELEGLI